MLLVLVFFIGLGASFLSNVSSGGGALVMLPTLLALGVAPHDAIGSIKLGTLGLVLGSAISSKNKGLIRKDHLLPIILIVTLASIIGPLISLQFSDDTVKVISSVLIVITAMATIITWHQGTKSRSVSLMRRNIGYFLYFITSLLLAGFGSGIGLLSSYILIACLGMSALETIATRRIAGLVAVPLQLIIFAFSGHIRLDIGLMLFLGSSIGGYLGLKLAIHKGNLFVKRAMALVAIILVMSLFL